MSMRNSLNRSLLAVAGILLSVLTNASAARAYGVGDLPGQHKIAQVTDYGDGVKISDYADKSGFESAVGNCRFIYRSDAKVLTFINEQGIVKTVSFAEQAVTVSQAK